jgi:hypothetical protein
LVAYISYEPPAWRNKLGKAIDKLPEKLTDNRFMDAIQADKKLMRAECAVAVFYYLGPEARVAIPELNRLMLATNSAWCSRRAGLSLSYIGEPALPVLLAAIQTRQQPLAIDYVRGMGRAGVDVHPAIPVLIDCLNDPDLSIAKPAAQCLGVLTIESGKVVPALITACGKDKDPELRRTALSALSRFGEAARPAIPVIIESVRDPRPSVAIRAVFSLIKLKLDFDVTLPMAIRSMRERNNFDFSLQVLAMLSDLGDDARPVVPELLRIMHDPVPNVSNNANEPWNELVIGAASNAVYRIAPEALGYSNHIAAPSSLGERYGGVKPP